MQFLLIVISAACLSVCVESATVSLVAPGDVKTILDAGVEASVLGQTVAVTADIGSLGQVLPAGQIVLHDPVIQPVSKPQIVTQTIHSSNPFSRLWDAIAAKKKAIGNLFAPPSQTIVVNIPPSPSAAIVTPTKPQKPIIDIGLDASLNPLGILGQRIYPVSVVKL